MKRLVERRDFETAYESQRLFIRRRFAELSVVGSCGAVPVIEA